MASDRITGLTARVHFDGGEAATHVVEVHREAPGRVRFGFHRINYTDEHEHENHPIPKMQAATFTQQLRSMNRAYAVTCAAEDQYKAFIELMLKTAYGHNATVDIRDLQD